MRFSDTDLDWLVDCLERAAQAEILPRFRHLSDSDIREKTSGSDLVTEADVNAERFITAELRDRFDGVRVVGEEAVAANPDLQYGWAGEGLAVTVDPVDGTFNFASGVTVFGVMAAVVLDGETVAGVIHDPVGGDTMVAARGGGAFVRREGAAARRLKAMDALPVEQMIGSVSWQFAEPGLRARLAANHTRFQAPVCYRCAAQDYRMLADGHMHFAFYSKLTPWDHPAGVLIHQEAGGHVAKMDGTVYRPDDLDGHLLAAPDAESWTLIRDTLLAG
ncbi:inositol monophosphatase [Zhengella mangrovi]|uniref:Inositol monophosphatase n=1 Tax=Zhengella mangrovi TaxID=1982044 RepID=A0A2G1QMM2_9HYPH|nr:inositol monophosphatase family protein [Zhengella mangrovi]PHP66724.1 inositol monophosphatase [Zhengella mangrovi]